MGVNYFTSEQIEILRKNPYVKNVSEKAITYTENFKIDFWIEYQQGIAPSAILRAMGFDPSILGERRCNNITQRIKKQAAREQGFEDTRKHNSGRPSTKGLTLEEQIERLNQKVLILQQENDFLKRVRYINKKQISKQSKNKPQKKNSN